MGIPGLINTIGPGERISLAKLAVTHLERTARPIRIAVDISIWLFQVQAGRGGRNPELRTLFFRLLKLLALPVHPLFVYDGPHKPAFKRGKAVSARSYGSAPIIRRSKDLLERFRFPWHEAPGEAEAECAHLQQAGIVDAVMSNDVDALMFGSSMTIMNFSKESGSGSTSASHVTCYAMGQDGHPSNIPLDRPGMILFAMLSGGDYLPSGIDKCGPTVASEIAMAGFGEDLLKEIATQSDNMKGLDDWRARLQYELDENLSGYFKSKHPSIRVPKEFPDQTILEHYARPKVSGDEDMEFLRNRLRQAWDQDIDPLAIRSYAAQHFDWNYRNGATRVTKLLAEPLMSYRLRLQRPTAGVSPDFSFVPGGPQTCQKVYKSRTSFSTDAMSELQLDMLPVDIVGLDLLAEELPPPANAGSMSQGSVNEDAEDEEFDAGATTAPQTPSKSRVTKKWDPFSVQKVWIFETVARLGIPDIVIKWEKEQAAKQAEQAEKARAAAARKTGTRRKGPKKKGPIDGGMKQGSILKYGTLTKERSELSNSGKAHLLEAATPRTSTKNNPLSRLVTGSGSSSPIILDQEDGTYGPSMYAQQGASPTMRYFSQQVDDLLESFNTMCNLSPASSAKNRPIADQPLRASRRGVVGASGIEFEESERPSLVVDDLQVRSAGPQGLRISHSTAELPLDEPLDSSVLTPPSPSKKSRPKSSKIIKSQLQDGSDEVHEIERAIESLSLSVKPDLSHDDIAPVRRVRESSPQKTKRERKPASRSSKVEVMEPSNTSRKPKSAPHTMPDLMISISDKGRASNEHALPSSTTACRKSNSQKVDSASKTTKVKSAITTPEHETKGHLENITIHDGFWSIDSSPSEDLAGPHTQNTRRRPGQGDKKKRISRVSIIDLV
ncbi:hypothetical protein N7541_005767 [Penicillium brevicompactum]|uniref:Uncharacterized protein n=1 Tax=Penicillium brevicompactum TaxID=5074 RepID=A0A9W9R6U7_PENBR|nr:hypothetical protein N7541_005767 [Penicillium brevicompactum]